MTEQYVLLTPTHTLSHTQANTLTIGIYYTIKKKSYKVSADRLESLLVEISA